MKKYTIRNPFSRDFENVIPKKNTAPSMTVPDQSMTVKEIQTRFANGIPVTANSGIPIYNGEEDFWNGVDPKTLDIVEINEIMRSRIQEVKDNKIKVAAEVKQRQVEANRLKAEREAKEIQQEVERREQQIQKLMQQRQWPQQPGQ